MDPESAASLPTLLWAIFVGAALLSITLGAILAYHWFRYAMSRSVPFTALLTYVVITFFLLSGLFAATIAVQSTL